MLHIQVLIFLFTQYLSVFFREMAEVEKEEDLEKDELMEACDMDPSEKRTLAMFLRTYSNKKKVT